MHFGQGQYILCVTEPHPCHCHLQDWLDIDFAIQMNVDFIAVSFVKTADVINNLKSYLNSRSSKVIEIVAKIESHDSVPNAQDIIEASDAVMIARGDLGNASSPFCTSAVSLYFCWAISI